MYMDTTRFPVGLVDVNRQIGVTRFPVSEGDAGKLSPQVFRGQRPGRTFWVQERVDGVWHIWIERSFRSSLFDLYGLGQGGEVFSLEFRADFEKYEVSETNLAHIFEVMDDRGVYYGDSLVAASENYTAYDFNFEAAVDIAKKIGNLRRLPLSRASDRDFSLTDLGGDGTPVVSKRHMSRIDITEIEGEVKRAAIINDTGLYTADRKLFVCYDGSIATKDLIGDIKESLGDHEFNHSFFAKAAGPLEVLIDKSDVEDLKLLVFSVAGQEDKNWGVDVARILPDGPGVDWVERFFIPGSIGLNVKPFHVMSRVVSAGGENAAKRRVEEVVKSLPTIEIETPSSPIPSTYGSLRGENVLAQITSLGIERSVRAHSVGGNTVFDDVRSNVVEVELSGVLPEFMLNDNWYFVLRGFHYSVMEATMEDGVVVGTFQVRYIG